MQVTRVYDSAEARFGVAGPFLLAQYRGATTLAVLDELDRAQAQLIEKRGVISTMTVIGQLGPLLRIDERVRQRSVELSKKYEKQVRGSAIVVQTRGLTAVMVRTFLTGFFLLSKAEMPMKTFSTIPEGLTWLQSLPGQDTPLRELRSSEVDRFLSAE